MLLVGAVCFLKEKLSRKYILLDGDSLRDVSGIDKYDNKSRNEQARIISKLSNLLNQQGCNVILCTNSINEENRNIDSKKTEDSNQKSKNKDHSTPSTMEYKWSLPIEIKRKY